MTTPAQAAILAPLPPVGRYLLFTLADDASPASLRHSLARLQPLVDGTHTLLALGPQLVQALGASVPGLREFPALQGPGVSVPSSPTAMLCWLRGDEKGDLLLQARAIEKAVAPALHFHRAVDGFRHKLGASGHGHDLTGYEDGTENPEGDAAAAAALVHGQGPGLDGGSFMAVQQWVHDMDAFDAMAPQARDDMMGRRLRDNQELDDAPASAHVKRTAQESFSPEAFVLRRSMPWALGHKMGLMFVAFGCTLDAYEAQMRRMAGLDDGIVDGIFQISKPVTGSYLWCPPMAGGQPDLRQLGM
jgi:putative iron-dependent peroxidase